jgi:hypothetical protein
MLWNRKPCLLHMWHPSVHLTLSWFSSISHFHFECITNDNNCLKYRFLYCLSEAFINIVLFLVMFTLINVTLVLIINQHIKYICIHNVLVVITLNSIYMYVMSFTVLYEVIILFSQKYLRKVWRIRMSKKDTQYMTKRTKDNRINDRDFCFIDIFFIWLDFNFYIVTYFTLIWRVV